MGETPREQPPRYEHVRFAILAALIALALFRAPPAVYPLSLVLLFVIGWRGSWPPGGGGAPPGG